MGCIPHTRRYKYVGEIQSTKKPTIAVEDLSHISTVYMSWRACGSRKTIRDLHTRGQCPYDATSFFADIAYRTGFVWSFNILATTKVLHAWYGIGYFVLPTVMVVIMQNGVTLYQRVLLSCEEVYNRGRWYDIIGS